MRPTRTHDRTGPARAPGGPAAVEAPAAGPAAQRWTGVLRSVRARLVADERDRGDVPGWVLVTLMTAGLVVTLWAVAGPRLAQVFEDSLSSVQGPGT